MIVWGFVHAQTSGIFGKEQSYCQNPITLVQHPHFKN